MSNNNALWKKPRERREKLLTSLLLTINKVLYTSDGWCTNFNIYYFILYLFLVINDSIFNLMMLIESRALLKTMLVVIYTKILHHSFIPFFTYLAEANTWKRLCRFDLRNWKIKVIITYEVKSSCYKHISPLFLVFLWLLWTCKCLLWCNDDLSSFQL